MNLDLSSFAFGSYLESGTGTPSWGTALGQSKPDYKFTYPGAETILIGMLYCSVPLDTVSLPLGKGGRVYKASEVDECQICSLFRKVYINGYKINYPFILVLIKEDSDSHSGRKSIKYSNKIACSSDGYLFSNEEFIRQARKVLELSEDACWFVYNFEVYNQDELHMSAVIVDKDKSVSYQNSSERKNRWIELIPESEDYIVNKSIPTNTFDFPLQQIFYGAPGTGKSHLAKEKTVGKSVIRTTFHPDSDYSTFVGAYKPTTIDEESVNIIGKEAVPVRNTDGSPRIEKKIIYEFVEQAFLQAYVEAWKLYSEGNGEKPKEQYLIIEEINRGNCAQIFGDLFQLLDRDEKGYSDYYIKADKDLQKYLKKELGDVEIHTPALCDKSAEEISRLIKEGEILLLPNNLYIWATMNTSDQSLFPIDSAFKRRWEWKYMPIANEGKGWTIEIGKNTYDWWEFLDKINTKIEDATYSEDKKLGYFFCKAKDGVVDAKTFVGKVLFYLWNDVFKDTDLADSLFADEDGKKSFDKFYIPMGQGETEVDTARVIAFMEKLTVKPLVEGENKEEEETDFVDENVIEGVDASSKGTKDTSVYSVNGIGSLRKKNVPHRVVSVYVEKNPDMTATEIVRAWNALGTMVTVVLSEDEYNRKKEKTSDSIFETRYNEIRLNNGEKIYVFNQFNPERINDFVSKVNAQSWGIRIEKVEE